MIRRFVFFSLPWCGAALLLLATDAQACSVCFSGNEETRTAFIVTTAFLSLLPLSLIGGIVYWLVKRIRAHEGEN